MGSKGFQTCGNDCGAGSKGPGSRGSSANCTSGGRCAPSASPIARLTTSCTNEGSRKRTSALVGCTLTSSRSGGISMKRCASGLRSLMVAPAYAIAMACWMLRSLTIRLFTKSDCGPRAGPSSVRRATNPNTRNCPTTRDTSTRSGRSPKIWKNLSRAEAAGGHCSTLRPLLVNVKPTSGYPRANWVTSLEICADSEESAFRNLRRAGRL